MFIRIYESYRGNPLYREKARDVLSDVYAAKGQGYVIKLLQSSERPEKPCFDSHIGWPGSKPLPPKEEWCDTIKSESEWCRAAHVLLFDRDGPPAEAPDSMLFVRYCRPMQVMPYYFDHEYLENLDG